MGTGMILQPRRQQYDAGTRSVGRLRDDTAAHQSIGAGEIDALLDHRVEPASFGCDRASAVIRSNSAAGAASYSLDSPQKGGATH